MSWSCTFCGFDNPSGSSLVCEICEQQRVERNPTLWPCTSCTFENRQSSTICEICNSMRISSPVPLYRTPSATMAEALEISLDIARKAIAAERGNVSAAAANFLLGIYPKDSDQGDTPLSLLASSSSSKFLALDYSD